MNTKKTALAIGSILGVALSSSSAIAAAPDWAKVSSSEIVAIYPGVSPIEWIQTGTEHGGARGMRKGDRCLDCHEEELADMGPKMATGQKLEPSPIKGKAGSISVAMQAAHDGEHLYLRFSWKQPTGGAAKMDAKNQVKLTVLFDGGAIPEADQYGCWLACHGDAQTMPNGAANKSKYVKDANLAGGVYYDLMQWTSSGTIHDGHIAESRVMDGGKALLEAKGVLAGDTWTVVFKRTLAATAAGDITLTPGKAYSFGIALHDDFSAGRFHQVSMGYQLGLDTKADITATKQ